MASFLIYDFMMRQGLSLKGCELLLFALIFSFSKKGLTMYESELSLSERLPYSREQIGKSLASLLSQGLIIRSKGKHPHRQSYDYSINSIKVQELLSSRGEDSSQFDVNKPDIKANENVTVSGEETTHNNITDNRVNNGDDNGRPRSPFRYVLLNNIWNTLIEEPKWKDKTTSSLNVLIEMLNGQKPSVAIEMMKYSLANGYRSIYDPKREILDKGISSERTFYEKENDARRPRCRRMLDELSTLIPEDLQPYLPSLSGCRIYDEKANITCPDAVRNWIENHSSETFPILKRWTMGLKLFYNMTTVNK